MSLTSNYSEDLCGTLRVSLDNISLTDVWDGSDMVSLDCGEGIQITEEGVSFVFVLPAVELEKGFTLLAIDSEGKVFEKSTSKKINIQQNVIHPMNPINAEFVEPYRLVYTAEEPVSSNSSYIIDHTFSNGTGSISILETTVTPDMFKVSNITSLVIPEGIKIIKEFSAFQNCKSLRTIQLPSTLEAMKYYTFQNCSSLESIVLPENLKYIDNGTFSGCSNLTYEENKGAITIGFYAFQYSGINKIELPASLLEIGNSAFANCTSLKTVILHSTTPPKAMNNASIDTFFTGCPDDMKIYVPAASVEQYKTDWAIYV